jgi:putative CocE/NonD family hydrolase
LSEFLGELFGHALVKKIVRHALGEIPVKQKALTLFFLLLGIMAIALSCGNSDKSEIESLGPGTSQTVRKIPLPDMGPETPYPVVKETGIPIVRPDDPERLKLYVDVYRPQSDEKFPALLIATAYRKELMQMLLPSPKWFASQGYVVVLLDVLGTGSSEGGWESLSQREIEPIAWIIDKWIPEQPWSNGKVGMYGPSYMGITTYLTAGQRPKHLKAIFPGKAMADAYRDIFFQGGIFDQEFMLSWARLTVDLSLMPPTQLLEPRRDYLLDDIISGLKALREHKDQAAEVFSWLGRTTDGPFFDERSPMTYWKDLAEIPIFTTAGWWGIFTRGSMLNYTEIVNEAKRIEQRGGTAGPKRIIVGPWYHITGSFMVGLPIELLHKRWFDWHLKADEDPDYSNYDILDPSSPVILYVLGKEQWRREKEWPLARARYRTLYLSGQKQSHDQNVSLNNGSLIGQGEGEENAGSSPGEGSTLIPYDPKQDPSRFPGQLSRSSCRWSGGDTFFKSYTEDERENEKNVLTFSTAPLDQDVEVTGPAVLRLWARSHFGPPCEDPPEIWYRVGNENKVDLTVLKQWAEQPDVQWTVNLNDVYPDGRVRNITSGWLAASHRPDPARPDWTEAGYDPFLYPEDENPSPPEEGTTYEYVIEIWPTSNIFMSGHQIRIDIATADFPHFLPSLVPSENEIFHDAEHPSRLVLPLVDPDSTTPQQWIEDQEAFFSGKEETWVDF